MKKMLLIAILILIGFSVVVVYQANVSSDTDVIVTPTSTPTSLPVATPSGSSSSSLLSRSARYETFATPDAAKRESANGSDVIYFFNAVWCPDCRAISRALQSDQLKQLRPGTLILSVDYDTYTDLKREYGVTHQTTFVRIDPEGKLVKKATLGNFSQLISF
jgi:thioredoxin 1